MAHSGVEILSIEVAKTEHGTYTLEAIIQVASESSVEAVAWLTSVLDG